MERQLEPQIKIYECIIVLTSGTGPRLLQELMVMVMVAMTVMVGVRKTCTRLHTIGVSTPRRGDFTTHLLLYGCRPRSMRVFR